MTPQHACKLAEFLGVAVDEILQVVSKLRSCFVKTRDAGPHGDPRDVQGRARHDQCKQHDQTKPGGDMAV